MGNKTNAVIIETQPAPQTAVIWLHGLGADGYDFAPIVSQLKLPDNMAVRFIFPHAPEQAVTLNEGFIMRAWYDIFGLMSDSKQDLDGIRIAAQSLNKIIAEQINQGICSEKIVLAGFSQGGALALHTGLRCPEKLGGVMGLSTYLPAADRLIEEKHVANQATPIFLAHGDQDNTLTLNFAEQSKMCLEEQGYIVNWHLYEGMAHSVCEEEIKDISIWLQKIL